MPKIFTQSNFMLAIGVALGAVVYNGFIKPYTDQMIP